MNIELADQYTSILANSFAILAGLVALSWRTLWKIPRFEQGFGYYAMALSVKTVILFGVIVGLYRFSIFVSPDLNLIILKLLAADQYNQIDPNLQMMAFKITIGLNVLLLPLAYIIIACCILDWSLDPLRKLQNAFIKR